MTNDEIIRELAQLIRLDSDAMHAYDEVLAQIEDEPIRSELSCFKEDHERHVAMLSAVLRELGGIPLERSEEFSDFLSPEFKPTATTGSTTGSRAALTVMHANERLVEIAYSQASRCDMQPFLASIIKQHLEDERRHLAYLQSILETSG